MTRKTLALAATMLAHHAAYLSKIHAAHAPMLERRDAPTLATVTEAIGKINEAFEEFKRTNDQRLAELKKGGATGDLDAKMAKLEKDISDYSEQKARLEKLETRLSRPGALTGNDPEQRETAEEVAHRAAFSSWLRAPGDVDRRGALQRAERELRRAQRTSRLAQALDEDEREMRAAATSSATGAAGGFALPEVIERAIARLSVDISPMRQIATVRTVGSTDYKELFDVNGAAFEWVGEGDTRNQTNTPDLAEVAPTFGMASAKPQATEESLDDLFFNVDNWLIESAAEAIGQGEGAAYTAGNGTKKPTGFLAGPTPVTTTDASRAFGTLQYIASGQASAMPTSLDTVQDVVYSLRSRYRRNARWVGGKLVFAALRKYKDTANAYLWQPAVTAGQPDMFMGYPVTEAEDMPVVAANAFPLAFGDFREGYLIADRVGMRITRDEITTPGYVKFYVRKRTGGKLRNTQAIKLLKIAAS